MMLKAKHHPVIYPFFKWYSLFIIKRSFARVNISGNYADKKLPVLLISNHIGWWDGFWAVYLNQLIFKRKFYFMMLEEQLKKHWYFNLSGGFSVKKNSRSIIDTLDYAAELLKEAGNIVLLFPQGGIESMHQHTIKFENGTRRILSSLENKVQVIFVANFTDYFSDKKPTLNSYLLDYSEGDFINQNLESAYSAFYLNSLQQQINLKK
jgi:1-acyl-sn-glycerol-3-phosphate acyltransferase